MSHSKLAIIAALAVSAGACGTTYDDTVYAVARQGVDFTQFHTYYLLDPRAQPGSPTVPSAYSDGFISLQNAIAREMGKVGVTQAASTTDADLVISPGVRQDSEVTWYAGWYMPYYYGYYWGYYYPYVTPVAYEVGTLVLDVVDCRSTTCKTAVAGNTETPARTENDMRNGAVVFLGVGQGVMGYDGSGPDRVNNAVTEMWKSWPR